MTTIADCKQGDIIEIPHGRFIVERVEDAPAMGGHEMTEVTLRRVDADDQPIEGDSAVLRFRGEGSLELR